jgi:transposase
MDTSEPVRRTRVRAYPPEFKQRVLDECEQPGTSIAKVARANGLNANMIHTWRRQSRDAGACRPAASAEFVALPLAGAAAPAQLTSIRIDVRRGTTSIAIAWPAEASESCASWLRELLR